MSLANLSDDQAGTQRRKVFKNYQINAVKEFIMILLTVFTY